jgi:LysM repeat protein
VANTLTPAATAEPTTTAAPTPTAIIHIVAKGDILSAIAKRYNVTVAAIVVANDLTNPDKLTIDQVLIIPLQPTPSATPTPSQ